MAGSSSSELRAPIFNGDNYEFWSIRMKTIFKFHRLWDLVEKGLESSNLKKGDESDMKKKEIEESSSAGKMTFTERLMKDAKALDLIQGVVSDEIFLRISHKETSKGHSKDLDVIEVQKVIASLKSFELRLDRHSGNKTERAFSSLNVNPKPIKFSKNQNTKYQKNWKAESKKWDNRSIDGARNPCKHCDKLHFGREDLLVDIDKNMTTKVEMGTRQLVDVTGKGNRVVETKMGKRYIKKVMHVPGLKENLRNVGQMMEHGYFLIIGDNKVEMYDDCSFSNMVAKVPMKGNRSFPMKLQSGIHIAFKASSGYKLKKLRSDKRGDYTSMEFNKFYEDLGMKKQLTTPYTPQQNGVAERKKRTIVEMAKCLMLEKKIPLEF
ncbi:uncharacterized protein [Pyrus communis]|uniref:uncharacterized protein n=1 Tax=Pyrus communis TaxID=23211 RepID=UPI0035C21975